ncbi:MAG: hypothetical protein ACRD4K_12735 [Candidatus Acidiferrales bacterium]
MTQEAIRVWFCGPDAGFAQAVGRALGAGFEVKRSEGFGVEEAAELAGWWDVILVDMRSSITESSVDAGLQLLEEINRLEFAPPTIVILPAHQRASTLQVMEHGAYDVVASPPDMVELRLILRRAYKFRQVEKEAQQLRSQQQVASGMEDLIGSSDAMQQVYSLAKKIAPCDVSVLITG